MSPYLLQTMSARPEYDSRRIVEKDKLSKLPFNCYGKSEASMIQAVFLWLVLGVKTCHVHV